MEEPIPEDVLLQLLANGRRRHELAESGADPEAVRDFTLTFVPVLKLFVTEPRRVWLLTELDPLAIDHLWGLRDVGDGDPMLDFVSINALVAARESFGLTVRRDPEFKTDRPIKNHFEDAQRVGRINV